MPKLRLEIVTAERRVLSEEVDMVIAPGTEGELGILPRHAPLLTMLKPGEMIVRRDGEEISLAISGGFLEVLPDKVLVLADAAERAEEIDAARAQAARERALARLETTAPDADVARAQVALQLALVRLKVAQRRRRRPH